MEDNKKANSGRQASDGTQGSLFKPRLARKKIENVVFEPVWRGKLFQMKALALRSILSNFRPNRSYPRDFSRGLNIYP